MPNIGGGNFTRPSVEPDKLFFDFHGETLLFIYKSGLNRL
jgi:hypothetical protein